MARYVQHSRASIARPHAAGGPPTLDPTRPYCPLLLSLKTFPDWPMNSLESQRHGTSRLSGGVLGKRSPSSQYEGKRAFPTILAAYISGGTSSDCRLPESSKSPVSRRRNHFSSRGLFKVVPSVREDPSRSPFQLRTLRIGNGNRNGDFRHGGFRCHRRSHDRQTARKSKSVAVPHRARGGGADLQPARRGGATPVFAEGTGRDILGNDHQMERSCNLRSEPGDPTAFQQHCRHPQRRWAWLHLYLVGLLEQS